MSRVGEIRNEELHIFGNRMYGWRYSLSIYGDIKINTLKAVGTQNSGYMAKKLLASMQTEVLDVKDSDCGTLRTIDITLTEKNSKDFKYRFIKEGEKLVLLTPEEMKKRIGKTVKMRSPMMCTGDKICNHCAGDLYYMLGIENIGLSASRVATTLTNLNMKKFHENLIVSKQISTDDIYF